MDVTIDEATIQAELRSRSTPQGVELLFLKLFPIVAIAEMKEIAIHDRIRGGL